MARYERYLYLIIELGVLLLAFWATVGISYGTVGTPIRGELRLLWGCIALLWVIVSLIEDFRPLDRRANLTGVLTGVVRSGLMAFLGAIAIEYLIVGMDVAKSVVPLTFAIFIVLAGLVRVGLLLMIRRYRKAGYNFKRIVTVGANSEMNRFLSEVENHNEYGYRLKGRFRVTEEEGTQEGWMDLHAFDQFVIENRIDEIYIATDHMNRKIDSVIRFCSMNNIMVKFVSEFVQYLNDSSFKLRFDQGGATTLITMVPVKYRNFMDRVAKRIFDIVFSSAVILLVLSWLIPVIALLIKLSSKGPVFFVQQRSGVLNKPFNCLKFRSMRMNAASDRIQASKGDKRITPIGAFLRKTNLDELPQFLNVFIGDMSVVGPRPHMLAHTDEYSALIDPYMERLWLKPGITGLAQAHGFRGETKELFLMQQRVERDRLYVYNWSLLLDIRIILITVWNMVTMQKQGY
jgi:undecaprenyl-phosphate galactose phosphotransferase/putative colanic acid biosynthesis UDP-glucose lipid carrier transferase